MKFDLVRVWVVGCPPCMFKKVEDVPAGTVLVELEPYDLLEREREIELLLVARESEYQRFVAGFREEEKAQAKAKLDQLQARLDLLKAGPRKQEIEAARGRLALAGAEKKLAEQDFQRLVEAHQLECNFSARGRCRPGGDWKPLRRMSLCVNKSSNCLKRERAKKSCERQRHASKRLDRLGN